MTFFEQIQEDLSNGVNYECEAADWYTVNNPSANLYMIMVRGDIRTYSNLTQFAKAVKRLLNTGA
jgi:hypothetical protein